MGVRLEMRVDMRRWALVLCSIGVMGGGCSARALISVGFSVPSSEEVVTGNPSIFVEWGGDTIRTIKDLDPIGVPDAPPKYVGVYLDYEGSISVWASLRTADRCEWKSPPKGTTAVRGERTEVVLELAPVDGSCPALTDAGVDGPANPEVGPLLPDGGTADVDGGQDTPERIESCVDYCDLYLDRCANWGAAETKRSDCVSVCSHWAAFGPDGSTTGDTLACRTTFLRAAVNPTVRCSMCPAASPESPGMCNALAPDASTRSECPIPPRSDGGDAP